jgi:hypothetical protein
MHNPVDRSERRISIMSAASLSGDYVIPFVIVRAPLFHNTVWLFRPGQPFRPGQAF